jgi:hypothetical protein
VTIKTIAFEGVINMDIMNTTSVMTALKDVIKQDLETQRSIAEIALNKVREIDEIMAQAHDQYLVYQPNPFAIEIRDTLLKIAQLLASNVTNTYIDVLNIVSLL